MVILGKISIEGQHVETKYEEGECHEEEMKK